MVQTLRCEIILFPLKSTNELYNESASRCFSSFHSVSFLHTVFFSVTGDYFAFLCRIFFASVPVFSYSDTFDSFSHTTSFRDIPCLNVPIVDTHQWFWNPVNSLSPDTCGSFGATWSVRTLRPNVASECCVSLERLVASPQRGSDSSSFSCFTSCVSAQT